MSVARQSGCGRYELQNTVEPGNTVNPSYIFLLDPGSWARMRQSVVYLNVHIYPQLWVSRQIHVCAIVTQRLRQILGTGCTHSSSKPTATTVARKAAVWKGCLFTFTHVKRPALATAALVARQWKLASDRSSQWLSELAVASIRCWMERGEHW